MNVTGQDQGAAKAIRSGFFSRKPEKRANRPIILIGLALILAIMLVAMLFINLISAYQSSIDVESANHLVEIAYQIKLYVEEKIENDWRAAHSVANSLAQTNPMSSDAELLAYMSRESQIWNTTEINLYTESGFGMRSDGEIIRNDLVSELAYYAQEKHEYMSIIQSEVTYTVAVNTDVKLHGSPVVAVSVVQDVSSFLDSMDFSSFGGQAYMYLTQDNGIVLSRLTHPEVSQTYNFISLMAGRDLACLSAHEHHTAADMLTTADPVAYMLSDPRGDRYVVSAPVGTRHEDMRLFYVAPEAVVNQTLDSFSSHVTTLSVVVLAVFCLLALVAFIALYRSRKRQFDQALVERERMFDLLVKNTNTAFALFSVDLPEPLFYSANTEKIFGLSSVILVKDGSYYRLQGLNGEITHSVEQINGEMRSWDGKSDFRSSYVPRNDGAANGYYAVQLYPVPGSDVEFVGVAQDTTQQHDREEAVRVALSMAERANEAKSRFLSNMSHDIRTPMNAIINMTDFAIETSGKPEQVEYLQTIRESSDHLLKLINDVLDMSRIESGQASIAAEPFDLTAELDRLCGIIRPLCNAKEQVFTVDYRDIKTAGVIGDQTKLSQILINLLNNAVKFTPKGGTISLIVQEMPSLRDNIAAIRFTVRDNGIGISETDRVRIFDPFTRVNDRQVRSIEGTGLGLSICRSYVTAMGGSIVCHSLKGKGSEFTVELFFQKTEISVRQKPLSTVGKTPYSGLRCLLCEDNLVNQKIACKVLERLGFAVDVAQDGGEGVRRFTASEPNHYAIIYMDIQMPVMNGYEATEAIRGSEHPQAPFIPIIAMTANVFAEDIERSRAVGMNGHLGKPINLRELVEVTNNVLSMGGQSE